MKEKIKNSNGITLIALIITIIILVILAAVSIRAVTNMGIVGHAINGTQQYAEHAKAENAMLDETGRTIEDAISKVKEIQGGKDQEKSKQEDDNWEVPEELAEKLQIGTVITYTPSGKYNWAAEYASAYLDTTDSDGDGISEEGDVLLASGATFIGLTNEEKAKYASSQDMTITDWKIFRMSADKKTIELVPAYTNINGNNSDMPTTNGVQLDGAQGYNNGVQLLNAACSALYSDTTKGITARSINIEDIEDVTEITPEILTQNESAYTGVHSKYPLIYAEEKLNVINGESAKSNGLGLSDEPKIGNSTKFYTRTENNASNGYLLGTSIQPYRTYYSSDLSSLTNGYENILGKWMFWVASRGIFNSSPESVFILRTVSNGGLFFEPMFQSNGWTGGQNYPLYPVISLSSNLISKDGEIRINNSFVEKNSEFKEDTTPSAPLK